MLQKISIKATTRNGRIHYPNLPLSYQIFGQKPGHAPVVLVVHALTGNSEAAGKNGWWNRLIGYGKCIDLNSYTVLAFDIPGNGYNGFLIKDYGEITTADIAEWFLSGLEQLKISRLFAGIGGSLGGVILWELALLKPDLFENLIPIAADWKATDWVLAQCRIQKHILTNSVNPLVDARMHAMTFYRSPQSFKEKFNRSKNRTLLLFNVETWLLHHGKKLQSRFYLQAYKLMNHLLTTSNPEMSLDEFSNRAAAIKGEIHLIGIDSDGFFLNQEIEETFEALSKKKKSVFYHQIRSPHGHDAFLIEYDQLTALLQPVFNKKNKNLNLQYHDYTTEGSVCFQAD